MTEEANNIILNPVNDTNKNKSQPRIVDEELFKEEFGLAKKYFEKQELRKKEKELNILPYFNYFLNNNNDYDQENIIDSMDSNKADNNILYKTDKMQAEKNNSYKINKDTNGSQLSKSFEKLEKGFLRVNLANNLFLIPINSLHSQFGYDYILNLFKQAVNIQDIANSIVDKAKLVKEGNILEFDIELKPDFIGDIKLKLTMIDGKLGITILASEELKKIIENSLDILKKNLINSNLVVDNLVILSQNEQGGQKNNYKYFKNFYGPIDDNKNEESVEKEFLGYSQNSVINYIT